MSALISVVAPVRNEGAGVDRFVYRVSEVLGAESVRYELVLVDDGSTDDSWERIVRHARVDDRVRGLRLTRTFGRAAAVRCGREHASGDAFVVDVGPFDALPDRRPDVGRRFRLLVAPGLMLPMVLLGDLPPVVFWQFVAGALVLLGLGLLAVVLARAGARARARLR